MHQKTMNSNDYSNYHCGCSPFAPFAVLYPLSRVALHADTELFHYRGGEVNSSISIRFSSGASQSPESHLPPAHAVR